MLNISENMLKFKSSCSGGHFVQHTGGGDEDRSQLLR